MFDETLTPDSERKHHYYLLSVAIPLLPPPNSVLGTSNEAQHHEK